MGLGFMVWGVGKYLEEGRDLDAADARVTASVFDLVVEGIQKELSERDEAAVPTGRRALRVYEGGVLGCRCEFGFGARSLWGGLCRFRRQRRVRDTH